MEVVRATLDDEEILDAAADGDHEAPAIKSPTCCGKVGFSARLRAI